ncbi:MAG TPA: ornithine--oxo-acid transaminase [Rectinemataceae bacterium]
MESRDCITLDETYGARNYHPLPVVISRARGCLAVDPEGKEYLDFLSAYSALNHGHLHPRIVAAAKAQLDKVSLTSRAFHNEELGTFLKMLCSFTGYEAALPMNTGAEAVETAIKACRRWGHERKGIPDGEQRIICAAGSFHGRTLAAISMSTDPDSYSGYGPLAGGFDTIPFGDPDAAASALDPRTVAIIVEPIQGEAGVVVPSDGYLSKLRHICDTAGILLVFDEIQTGFCRTGKRFAWQYEEARPDIMCLGKALGGGILPLSAIVADWRVMSVFTPGTHGSTFGGNPLASAVGRVALEVLEDERLDERAFVMGRLFRGEMETIRCAPLEQVRGKGLLNAAVFEEGFDAYSVCLKLKEAGLLAKQTHGNIIRFAPPLVISEEEMKSALKIIKRVFSRL